MSAWVLLLLLTFGGRPVVTQVDMPDRPTCERELLRTRASFSNTGNVFGICLSREAGG